MDAAFKIVQNHLGEDWLHLAFYLDLGFVNIQQIRREKDLIWQSRCVLEKWKEQQGKKATVDKLLEALKKIGRQDLAEKVREELYPESLSQEQDRMGGNQGARSLERAILKTDESFSALNEYQATGQLATDLQAEFEKIGFNIPLQVAVLTTEELEKEVAEIVEEAMEVFVLSETAISRQTENTDIHKTIPSIEEDDIDDSCTEDSLEHEVLKRSAPDDLDNEVFRVIEEVSRELNMTQKTSDSAVERRSLDQDVRTAKQAWDEKEALEEEDDINLAVKKLLVREMTSELLLKETESVGEDFFVSDVSSETLLFTCDSPDTDMEEESAKVIEEVLGKEKRSIPDKTDEDVTDTDRETSTQTYEELRDAWRDALLRITAWTGDEDKVKTLLQAGVQVNTENSEGETPLWDAVRGGHPNIVKLLLQAGANPNTVDINGSTPLLHATSLGYREVCRALVCGGADVNMADMKLTHVQTPLRIAIEKSDWLMLTTLIRPAKHLCANVNKPLGTFGCSLLSLSVKKLTDFEKGIDGDGMESSMVEYRREWYVEWCERVSIFETLRRAGAKIDSADRLGMTLLQSACREGCAMTAKLLLDNGADPDKHDDNGRSPIWVAAWQGHTEIVSALIQEGADLNKADTEKKTPLWIAARKGHERVVTTLIEAGADISLPDITGMTPLRAARQMNRHAVVSMLKKAACRKPCTERVRKTSSREKSPGYHTTEDFEYG
ncbi:Ankyrin-2 [Branchiostoma belcheri]|nr:Ankyrin-2 [Branchiostoma belcheri]